MSVPHVTVESCSSHEVCTCCGVAVEPGVIHFGFSFNPYCDGKLCIPCATALKRKLKRRLRETGGTE